MHKENFEQSEKDAAKSTDLAIDFTPNVEEIKAARDLNTPVGDSSKQFLPPIELTTETKIDPIAKEFVDTFKEKGPKAAMEAIRKDLKTYEQEQFSNMKHVAKFDEETSTQIAHERSTERWEAIKKELCQADPNAIEKMKVAYLDSTLKEMSNAGGRYGNLDQYGVSAKGHFENQKTNGTSPMVREFAGEIAKDYNKISDPGDKNNDSVRISSRELQSYRSAQEKLWQ